MKKLKVGIEVNLLVSDTDDREEIKERLYENLLDQLEADEIRFKVLNEDEDDEYEEI